MFCSNCGSQVEEGNAFCPKCGTAVGGRAPVAQAVTRLSLEDFLAMSEEYKKEKEMFDVKNRKTPLIYVGLAIGSIFLGAMLTFILFNTIPLFLGFVGMGVFIYRGVAGDQRRKRELEARGGELYKEYLKKNGFPTV